MKVWIEHHRRNCSAIYNWLAVIAPDVLSCNNPLSGFWDQDQPEFFRPSRKILHDALAMLALIVVLPHIDVLRTMFEHALHQPRQFVGRRRHRLRLA